MIIFTAQETTDVHKQRHTEDNSSRKMSSCVGCTAPCTCLYKHERRQLSVLKIRQIVWKNYVPVQAQINSIVLNNILQISYYSSPYNIHNKIVPGNKIESTIPTDLCESTIPTDLRDVWMKFLLMSRPATFTVSLIHKGMTVATLVHCIVVSLIIHSCACTAVHKRYLPTSQ